MTHELHGLRHSGLYMHWANIKNRCYNKKSPRYKDWGGRGITMYEPWKVSFKSFYEYIIKLPNYGHEGFTSIDRINNEKGYEPGNIRWAKELKLGKDTIHQRHRKGWTDYECLFGKEVHNEPLSISKRCTRKNKK